MVVNKSIPRLRTPGVIATELDKPLHRVLYILRTRMHIKPVARAGQTRLYDREAVAMVRYELNSMDARRQQEDHYSSELKTLSKKGTSYEQR